MNLMHAPLATTRLRLGYQETDPSGRVYFAVWFPVMERLHVQWFHDHGFRFDQMHDRVGAAPVTRATTCEYLAAVGVYDEVDVEMRLARIGTTSLEFGFEITCTDSGVAVARSTLSIVYVDRRGRPAAVPALVRDLLAASSNKEV